jgi:hypothetical protein
MYFDNLTIAGLLVVSLYGLLPLLFRGEILRVEGDDALDRANVREKPPRDGNRPPIGSRQEQPEPCR